MRHELAMVTPVCCRDEREDIVVLVVFHVCMQRKESARVYNKSQRKDSREMSRRGWVMSQPMQANARPTPPFRPPLAVFAFAFAQCLILDNPHPW